MLSQRQALELLSRLPFIGRLGPSFLRYLLAGGFGFFVDWGGMELLVRLGVSVYAARAFSMTFAIFCTYLLHRNFTFADAARPARTEAQLAAFVACQLFAAAVNYGVFCLLLALLPQPEGFFARMIALCGGVGAGLAVNFALLRFLVFPEKGAPAYELLMPRNRWRLLPWALPLGYFLHLAIVRTQEVLAWPKLDHALGPADPDVWLRLAQVRQWMAGGDFFDHAVRGTNAPFGGVGTHWTRPMDMLLALFTQLMPAGEAEARLMLAAAWLPPALGLFALVFLARAALRRFDNAHAVWAMMALAALSPLAAYFMPGDADHHGLLAMLWCGALCLLMRRLTLLSGFAAGALLGAMMWVSVEAIMPLAAVYAVRGALTLRHPEKMPPLAALAAGAAVMAAIGLMFEVPPHRVLADIPYDTLSAAWVALLAFIAVGAAILALPQVRGLSRELRVMAALGVALAAFLAEIALFPRMLMGPMADAHHFIGAEFLKKIGEAKPMFDQSADVIIRHLWQPALAFVLLCMSRGRRLRRWQKLMLADLLILTFGMTLLQARWTYYLQPVAMITAAAMLPGLAVRLRALSRVERPFRPYAGIFCAAALAIFAGMALSPDTQPSAAAICQEQTRYAMQTGQLQARLGDAPVVVYAQPGLAGDMLFFTPYRVIAGNYHREGEGLSALHAIATEKDSRKALKRLAERQVEAMVFCPETQAVESWLRNPPHWLTPAKKLDLRDLPGPKPQLFTIAWEK